MAESSMIAKCKIVVIGGSAGSLEALLKIVPALRADLQLAIIIVVHRKYGNDAALVQLLGARTLITVKEAEEKEEIVAGSIYVAPADYHLLVEKDHTFSLDVSEKVNYSRPSIDVTFEVAADIYGASATCILLSGANADGVAGLWALQKAGGVCVVQDPATAPVPYMPQQAINSGVAAVILPGDMIAAFINNMAPE